MDTARKMLVEGESDKRAIQAIEDLKNVTIKVAGRFSNLCEIIESDIKAPMGITSLAIVFDANGQPKEQWKAVRNVILEAYGLTPATSTNIDTLERAIPAVPEVKHAGGIWVDNYKPWFKRDRSSLGLWMMPNNHEEGALEEFLVRIVDLNNPYWKPALDYVKEISDINKKFPSYDIFPERKITKARIHAWLAIQKSTGDPPGLAMANAIQAGSLDIHSKEAQNLKTWLSRLK